MYASIFDFKFNSYSRTIKAKVELFNGSTLAQTFSYNTNLQSLKIERQGEENKFFGFGVCQKLTMIVIDAAKAITVDKGAKLQVTFLNESGNAFKMPPVFEVSAVQRDENSGNLTITAYDALYKATAHTVAELNLTGYTIQEFALAIAGVIGLGFVITGLSDLEVFNTYYPESANFSGAESLRDALNAIAEATQTIYYVGNGVLYFRRLNVNSPSVLTIEKADYFTLKAEAPVVLMEIGSITELGDNISASTGAEGEAQYLRNNPFWDLREDVAELAQAAIDAVGGMSITPHNLEWRGNFLLEIGDKIAIKTKDNNIITTFVLNDTISYNGGLKAVNSWKYAPQTKEATNPATLGEAVKQTFAKVDKANKQIEIVSSVVAANAESISKLAIDTESINASVQSVEKSLADATDGINADITKLTETVNAKVTAKEVSLEIKKELDNGVSKVATGKGFTFDDSGLTIEDINPNSNNAIKTTVSNNGMTVYSNGDEVLTANDKGVTAKDLHAKTYLIIGENSRFEDLGDRTVCFWIGG